MQSTPTFTDLARTPHGGQGLSSTLEILMRRASGLGGPGEILRVLGEIDRDSLEAPEQRLLARVRAYMEDLREDSMELCLEDLDMLHEAARKLDGSPGTPDPFGGHSDPPETAPCKPKVIRRRRPEPWHRSSGLLVQDHSDQVWIVVPSLDEVEATNRVLRDLPRLADETGPKVWVVDLATCQRLPLRVLSSLVGMSEVRGLRIQLVGLQFQRISAPLIARLSRYFDIE